jgi:hypothetical protein
MTLRIPQAWPRCKFIRQSTHLRSLVCVKRALWTLLLLLLARHTDFASVLPELPDGLSTGALSANYYSWRHVVTNTWSSRPELRNSCSGACQCLLHLEVSRGDYYNARDSVRQALGQ